MFKKLKFLKDRALGSKPISVFITDSSICPCFHFLSLNPNKNVTRTVQIKDISADASDLVLAEVYKRENVILYAHGDNYRLNFYYRVLKGSKEEEVLIPEDWWKKMYRERRKIYFHVCSGSSILKRNSKISEIFTTWVSYSSIVYVVVSKNDQRIKELNRFFIEQVSKAIENNKSALSIKNAIIEVYKSIENRLKEGDQRIRGYTFIISAVGKNVNSLECS